jgi:hypothetical protein
VKYYTVKVMVVTDKTGEFVDHTVRVDGKSPTHASIRARRLVAQNLGEEYDAERHKVVSVVADVEDPHPGGCFLCGRDLAEAPFTIHEIDGVPENVHTHCLDNRREEGEIIKKLDEVGKAWDTPTEEGATRDEHDTDA